MKNAPAGAFFVGRGAADPRAYLWEATLLIFLVGRFSTQGVNQGLMGQKPVDKAYGF